jgi:hypothetical protein
MHCTQDIKDHMNTFCTQALQLTIVWCHRMAVSLRGLSARSLFHFIMVYYTVTYPNGAHISDIHPSEITINLSCYECLTDYNSVPKVDHDTERVNHLSAMIAIWYDIIASFKVLTERVHWISWVNCISERLTGPTSVFRWVDIRHIWVARDEQPICPTSTHLCITEAGLTLSVQWRDQQTLQFQTPPPTHTQWGKWGVGGTHLLITCLSPPLENSAI